MNVTPNLVITPIFVNVAVRNWGHYSHGSHCHHWGVTAITGAAITGDASITGDAGALETLPSLDTTVITVTGDMPSLDHHRDTAVNADTTVIGDNDTVDTEISGGTY